ncbi:hypothetical protein [Flavobacterium crocinum]|nr:hypothetical protein [Flavobacterium crocinum]
MKQFFSILVLTLLFFGCSSDDNGSDNSGSDYFFKATLDGRKIDFYDVNFQGGGNDNRFEHITVGGFEEPYPNKVGELIPPSLDFEIWRTGGDIKAGTYSTPTEPEMVARYAVQTTNGTIVYSTSTADDVFTLKIESISKNGIKGTFSGKVRNLDSGVAIEITEGTFNLPYEDIINTTK